MSTGWPIANRRSKYTYAGAVNTAVWRALNAPASSPLNALRKLANSELGVSVRAGSCGETLDNIRFPAKCDFFGKAFGGKAHNCRFC